MLFAAFILAVFIVVIFQCCGVQNKVQSPKAHTSNIDNDLDRMYKERESTRLRLDKCHEEAQKEIAANRKHLAEQQDRWARERKERLAWIEKQRKDAQEVWDRQFARPNECPNCGAPKRGSVCEYCGTQF